MFSKKEDIWEFSKPRPLKLVPEFDVYLFGKPRSVTWVLSAEDAWMGHLTPRTWLSQIDPDAYMQWEDAMTEGAASAKDRTTARMFSNQIPKRLILVWHYKKGMVYDE